MLRAICVAFAKHFYAKHISRVAICILVAAFAKFLDTFKGSLRLDPVSPLAVSELVTQVKLEWVIGMTLLKILVSQTFFTSKGFL